MFEAFCEDINLDKRKFDERYGKSQFPSGNVDPRKVFKTCYIFCDELFLEPTMS